MSDGYTADYDAIRSLSSVLDEHGREVTGAARAMRGVTALEHPDAAAGLGFVRDVWGRALAALGGGLALTAEPVDQAVTGVDETGASAAP